MVDSIRGTGPIGNPDDSGGVNSTRSMNALPKTLLETGITANTTSVKGYGFPKELQKSFVLESAQILSKLKID